MACTLFHSLLLLLSAILAAAESPKHHRTQIITAVNRTEAINLAVSPACNARTHRDGFAKVNTGIKLNVTK